MAQARLRVPSTCLQCLALLLPVLLNGCAEASVDMPAACTLSEAKPSSGKMVQVYFGCGCFWHMQHEFVSEEMTKLCRKDGNLTSRVAYAGGTKVGEGGLVCYHNSEGKADYGQLGHAEVVVMTVPEADFESFAGRFFEACPAGARRDVQDMGGEYRSVIGLPGGMTSPLLSQVRAKAGKTKLVAGRGDDGDTLGTGTVLVYDTAQFPAHVAEKYHQFHDDMLDKSNGMAAYQLAGGSVIDLAIPEATSALELGLDNLPRLDPMGGIVMTNDGNAILREVDVSHPAAKNMIEPLASESARDEEVGDGTTSVIILAGSGYMKALEDAQTLLKELAYPVDLEHPEALREIVRGSIDTKFASRFGTLISDLAIKAVKTVCIVKPDGRKEIDVKRFAKVEKIQGGELTDCQVLDGVMFNKDITHPRMSQTNVEITKEADWEKLLQQEEEEMRRVCDDILKVKPDLVITEKGDLAQHFLMKETVRAKKRCCDRHFDFARCGRFKVSKVGEEYFTYLTECQDAFAVARNIILEPLLLPGGGAVEMELAARKEKSKSIEGSRQYAYKAVGEALEVIPRSADVVRAMTDLRARHAATGNAHIGIDGKTGKVADVKVLSIFDTFAVKQQTLRTSIEAAAMLLRAPPWFGVGGRDGHAFRGRDDGRQKLVRSRKQANEGIDDIISGISKKKRDDKPSAVLSWVLMTKPLAIHETVDAATWVCACYPSPTTQAALQARARGGSATVNYPFSNRYEYIDKLHQCAQAGDAERAETWFADMEAAGFRHDLQAYNILLNVYAARSAVDSVDEVLETMRANACQPDEYTLSSAIRSCERRADVRRAEAYLRQMCGLGVLPNHAVYNTLLEVCAAAGDVAGASRVLGDMQNESVRKDTVIYNTALSVAAKAGDSEIAAKWFHQMTSAGLQPDAHSHAAVLGAYMASNDPGEAEKWLQKTIQVYNNAGTVDLAEDAVRLRWKSRWCLIRVPQEAQPLRVADAKCRFLRRCGELVVRWPGTTEASVGLQKEAHAEDLIDATQAPRSLCDFCGRRAVFFCSKCRASTYCSQSCSQSCQKSHWVQGHRHRCRLAGPLAAARSQLRKGEIALSLATAEEAMKAHVSAIKTEADKEYAFDCEVVLALSKGLATAQVLIAEALAADKDLASHKFCRACFSSVAAMLDLAAALKEERCPPALWTQAQAVAQGIGDRGDADPVLSAWMLYDAYARGLADRPSSYTKALSQMRIVALLAVRDMLAASTGLLQGTQAGKQCFADMAVAESAAVVLQMDPLKVCREDLGPLREFYPQKGALSIGVEEEEEDDEIQPWHKF
ncbi:T-complex protein 1 subunit gamma [Symbiodinium microadriaticum]|uniref:T-complex protein 1 subunit gamma n=1 Tax=Symbiodinium microadriaticum TaxID=2951 RepID=A0A1Q9CHZ1_SYMMI|nr:T-complex protein 1 subunit gamma [Symbiodinium microadriaticum]